MRSTRILLPLSLFTCAALAQTQPAENTLRFAEETATLPSFSTPEAWRTRQNTPETLTVDSPPARLIFRTKADGDYEANNDLGSNETPLVVHSLVFAPAGRMLGNAETHTTIKGNPLRLVADEAGSPPSITLGARDPRPGHASFDLALDLHASGELRVDGEGNQRFRISGHLNQADAPLRLVKSGASTLELTAASAWSDGTKVNAGEIRLANGDALGNGAVSIATNAKLSFDALPKIAGLSTSLEIAERGHLDLHGGAWIIDYQGESPYVFIHTMVRDGRIGSSDLAVNQVIACVEASAAGLTEFAGRTLDKDALVVAVVRPGDTNLDFKVDLEDLKRVKAAFNHAGSWADGDVTGDGRVDFEDLLKIAQNYDSKDGFDVDWQRLQ